MLAVPVAVEVGALAVLWGFWLAVGADVAPFLCLPWLRLTTITDRVEWTEQLRLLLLQI
jgi:hypothetical protein